MRRVFRFIRALYRYILYGKRVDFDTYVGRLEKCRDCGMVDRDGWSCGSCGCYLVHKAKMDTEDCPEKRW